jgi:hypothetical protein
VRKPRSFKQANERRLRLIDKKYGGGGLTPEEEAEYEMVDKFVDDWMERKHPRDTTMLDEMKARLDEIKARLAAKRRDVP